MVERIQNRIYDVLREAAYNGRDEAGNEDIIGDIARRKATGSHVPEVKPNYDNAIYNYVAMQLSVGVNVLQAFAEEYNIDVERVALKLRADKQRVAYMKRAVQDGSEKDAIRMAQAYPGPLQRRDRRRRRRA